MSPDIERVSFVQHKKYATIVFYIILFLRWVGNPMSSRTTGRLTEMFIDSEHVQMWDIDINVFF